MKLPKAVRDAVALIPHHADCDANFGCDCNCSALKMKRELIRVYFAGMKRGAVMGFSAVDSATVLSVQAEIRRMEKEAKRK